MLLRNSSHNHNTWGLPGGNADREDDDLMATAVREAHEEMTVLPEYDVLGQVCKLPCPQCKVAYVQVTSMVMFYLSGRCHLLLLDWLACGHAVLFMAQSCSSSTLVCHCYALPPVLSVSAGVDKARQALAKVLHCLSMQAQRGA